MLRNAIISINKPRFENRLCFLETITFCKKKKNYLKLFDRLVRLKKKKKWKKEFNCIFTHNTTLGRTSDVYRITDEDNRFLRKIRFYEILISLTGDDRLFVVGLKKPGVPASVLRLPVIRFERRTRFFLLNFFLFYPANVFRQLG